MRKIKKSWFLWKCWIKPQLQQQTRGKIILLNFKLLNFGHLKKMMMKMLIHEFVDGAKKLFSYLTNRKLIRKLWRRIIDRSSVTKITQQDENDLMTISTILKQLIFWKKSKFQINQSINQWDLFVQQVSAAVYWRSYFMNHIESVSTFLLVWQN